MQTLFVTGGAGFIGSNFVRYWRTRHPEDRVLNYDALTYAGNLDNLSDIPEDDHYRFVQGDIGDKDTVSKVFAEEKPDIIVNFAAESHNSRAVLDPALFFRTNLLGTQNLLQQAVEHSIPRFHHISTCEVYGDLPLDTDEKFTEESPCKPRTPYNASKAAADMAVRAYHETYELPVTISNCCNNYGPYQFPEKVLPHFAVRVLQGEQMPLYKSSHFKREWIHTDDHCKAIDRILAKGRIGETYNVGTEQEASVEDIANVVIEALGKDESAKTYVEDRPGHDRRYLLDSSKLRTELCWDPEVPFADGMKATVEWYRDNEDWWKPLLERLAIAEDKWKK